MEDEERSRNRSSNSSVFQRNGRNSKKAKPKKVPQRGLGVAQLEKIRMEEEEEVKNDTVLIPTSSQQLTSNLYNRSASSPSLPLPSFDPNARPCPFPTGHVSADPRLSVGHHSIGQVNIPAPGNGCPLPFFAPEGYLVNSEYIREVEKSSPFTRQLGNQHSSLNSSSMVNAIAANSSFQTEPPSNQSPYGTYQSVQPDDAEKIVGAKRPCPFPSQDPSDPLVHCKFNPFAAPSLGRSNSLGNPGPLTVNGSLREGLQCSMSMPDLQHRRSNRTDCANSDGGFLKLGPPATMSSLPSSKLRQVHEQGSNSQGGSNISTHHQQQQGGFKTTLPAPNNVSYGQSTIMTNHNNGETEDNVDLSLKL